MSNISIEVHHYIHYEGWEMKLSAAMAAIEGGIDAIEALLDKAKDEIIAKISELEAMTKDPDVDPTALTQKFEELTAKAQAMVDIIPGDPTPVVPPADPVPPVEAPPVVDPVPVVDPAPVVDTTPVDVSGTSAEAVLTDPAPPA